MNLDVILEPKSPAAQGWWKEEYFLTRDAAHAQAGSSSCCSSHFAKGDRLSDSQAKSFAGSAIILV
jgi:hypothetical protein